MASIPNLVDLTEARVGSDPIDLSDILLTTKFGTGYGKVLLRKL
jgi:hypothetical protein